MRTATRRGGFALVSVVAAMLMLALLGMGLLQISYGRKLVAVRTRHEARARYAAYAALAHAEEYLAVQIEEDDPDIPDPDEGDSPGAVQSYPNSGFYTLESSTSCKYKFDIQLYDDSEAIPVYRLIGHGHSGNLSGSTDGRLQKTVEMLVRAGASDDVYPKGWLIRWQGKAPTGTNSGTIVPFTTGEVISMPMEITDDSDPDDVNETCVEVDETTPPRLIGHVNTSGSRYTNGGSDKYASLYDDFQKGIDFGEEVDEFDYDYLFDQVADYIAGTDWYFQPRAHPQVHKGVPAVQMEFFRDNNGIGKMRLFNNCTVETAGAGSNDWKSVPGTDDQFEQYDIYSHHYIDRALYHSGGFERNISDVTNGTVYVDGNVIIGGRDATSVLQGKLTIIATGNIWIASSVKYSDYDDSGNYYARENLDRLDDPTVDPNEDLGDQEAIPRNNPNVLGLVSRDGVVKVIDPEVVQDAAGPGVGPRNLRRYDLYYSPVFADNNAAGAPRAGYEWAREYTGFLSGDRNVEVEANIIVGGGGFGMENVDNATILGNNKLTVRGLLREAVMGQVKKGFKRHYYLDRRILDGTVDNPFMPGFIWERQKASSDFSMVPGSWKEY